MKMRTFRSLFPALAVAMWMAGPSQAAFVLVDDLESYTVGSYNGGSTAFTANGGPWESNVDGGTGLVGISLDGANQYIDFGWNSGQRGVQRTAPTIADGDAATYYWQVRSAGTGNTDLSTGLSYKNADGTFGFGDFEVQISLIDDNAGALNLGARNGVTTETTLVTGLSLNTWYDVWVVVDNASDTYDAYWGTSGDPNSLGTKFADDFVFRNSSAGAQSSDLVTFAALSNNQNPDRSGQVNNIYYNSTAIPEPSTIALIAGAVALLGYRRIF